jgi:fatty acid desaturase
MRLFLGELRVGRSNLRRSIAVWIPHLLACAAVVFWIVGVCHMSFWVYFGAIVYPANALSLLRSFAEHRAADKTVERTAIVENASLFGLLFLFNNLHVVHHDDPALPWYQIPGWYRDHRAIILQKNGGLVYNGYFEVARRYAFTLGNPIYLSSP